MKVPTPRSPQPRPTAPDPVAQREAFFSELALKELVRTVPAATAALAR